MVISERWTAGLGRLLRPEVGREPFTIGFQPMKHRLLHHAPVAQVLDDDALEERRGDARVPDAFRVHDDDRAAGADAEARGLAALHAARAEQQPLPLEEAGEGRVERAPFAVR